MRLTESQKAERRKLIIKYALAGFSANRIQRELREKGLGMRRQTLFKRVKEIRSSKMVSVYGSYMGKSRRVDLVGTGRELYEAMKHAIVSPPKQRHLVIQAKLLDPFRDLMQVREWDARPDVDYPDENEVAEFWEEWADW